MTKHNTKSKKLKWIFPFLATFLLAPWPIAYAHDAGDGVLGQDAVQIEVAEPSAMPSWHVFGRAMGGVDTPGDLFYIDATKKASDSMFTLYLTNTQELSHCYSYLILKVEVYAQSSTDQWKKACGGNGGPMPDIFITLRNGRVSFTLAGYAKYKVTIYSGSFYCVTTNTERGSISPQFYLTTDQA